jgi:hypothetical protein
VSHATTDPNRAREVTSTRTAGSLLTPRFATGKIDFRFGLSASRAATTSCLDCNNDIVDSLVSLGFVCDEIDFGFSSFS